MTSKSLRIGFGAFLFVGSVWGNNSDLFNYGYTTFDDATGKSYGQPNWASITCDDPSTCTGFGEKYPFTPYDFQDTLNNCKWCPDSGSHDVCGLHRQSPVDLKRDRAILGGPNEKECPDWHYMQTRDDTCSFDDMRDMFSIERHGLRLEMPQQDDGQIACEEFGQRMYPRLDYSKGFPNWWFLQRTMIFVPSQHTQEGIQYAAEVVLEHFYELDHYKNQLGHVSIFLQDYPDVQPWAYLEKLICNWRIAEDKVREKCGLPAATPYGRCRLFRGQAPTPEWLAEEAGQIFTIEVTKNPLFNATSPAPVSDVAAPNILDTHAPFPPASPTFDSTSGTASPVPPPVVLPSTETPVIPIPVVFITPSPVAAIVNTAPQPVQCDVWDINYDRMCNSDDPCCGDVRSDTAYCWGIYDLLGTAVEAVCNDCCDTPLPVGPVAPVLTDLPQQIQCSALDNIPHRMCKTDSCCSNPRSESEYCRSQYDTFNDNELAQICHYCCSSPQVIGPAFRERNLLSEASTTSEEKKEETRVLEGAKEFNVYGKKFLLGKENFDPIEEDEQTYFDRQYAEHQRRNQQTIHLEDYEDLDWAPYEWLFRVETEYYFRYEGTMFQPPCWEVVHWRPLKDPIRVHKRQIDELNRLMAWRLNPDTCARETAGIVSADSSRITAHREVQYMHDQHRFVFCECKDWPSKFKGDREWCHRWNEDTTNSRFYERPYSFDQNAGWLP